MAHTTYPNRERALRQLERGRVRAQSSLYPGSTADIFAYLQSDEHREKMRRIGETVGTLFENLRKRAG